MLRRIVTHECAEALVIVRKPWYPPVEPVLRELANGEALELVGVTDAAAFPEEETRFRRWLETGRHGEMHWMARSAAARYNPEALLQGCRSIIFVALNYYQKTAGPRGTAELRRTAGLRRTEEDTGNAVRSETSGRIARYAWGRDYHKELGKRIKRVARLLEDRFPGERFRAATDATPLAERFYAEQAGVGFTGRNTLLISGQYGSWFILGEILSTRRFDATGHAGKHHGACPAACKRCIEVCPTGALVGPHEIDASRCISYLTIEHKGIIPESLRPLMGDWLFGCDLCQEVCPLNVRAQVTTVERFLKPIAGDRRTLREVLSIADEDEYISRFAGSPLMRAGRRGLLRNACIVAANLRALELVQDLRERADDYDRVVGLHARWALDQLESTDD